MEPRFTCGEYDFTGMLVTRFACFHRQNYGGCKGGVSYVVVGVSVLMVDLSGHGNVGHVKEKRNEMIHMTETLFCCLIACLAMGMATPSDACSVNPLMANVSKHNVTKLINDIDRLA